MAISTRGTRVLAFLQAWSPALEACELGAIRAHLRGLGAELVIAADAGAWWLGPDDEIRPAARAELGPDPHVILVDEEDPYVNEVGAKGIGEIGNTGASAALANAVFHATGRRIRDLPIRLDKVMGA
jgi:hypothetical protein